MRQNLPPLIFVIVSFVFIATQATIMSFDYKFVIIIFLCCLLSLIDKSILLDKVSTKYSDQKHLFDTFCETCPDVFFYKNLRFEYILCNQKACEALGLKKVEDMIGKTDFDLMSLKSAKTLREHDELVIKYGSVEKYILTLNIDSTGERIFEIATAPTYKNGKVIGLVTIARDMTIRENLKVEYKKRLIELTSIMENLPLIAYMKDTNGRYIRGNDKLAKVLKCSNNEIVGKKTKDIYSMRGINCFSEIDDEVIKNKKGVSLERIINIGNGVEHWYRIDKAPIFDEAGEVSALTVFITDISAEKELEKQKETFVATLSHDLKTPTIAQVRSLELLLNGDFGELNTDQKDMVQLILDSCKYMYDMVSNVLSTYKYENGEIHLNFNSFDIEKLTQECCKELEHLLQEKNMKVRINQENLKRGAIYADRIQIKRVITNLLANSLSYAYQNSEILIILENNDNNDFIFKLKNKSPYIEPQLMKTLFQKYTTHASKYNKVGDGLGLYLVKQIVMAHNGEVIAESQPNEENIFGFYLKRNVEIADTVVQSCK